jgi:hypothetical protein
MAISSSENKFFDAKRSSQSKATVETLLLSDGAEAMLRKGLARSLVEIRYMMIVQRDTIAIS